LASFVFGGLLTTINFIPVTQGCLHLPKKERIERLRGEEREERGEGRGEEGGERRRGRERRGRRRRGRES
jgi:hypothetical protein